MRKTLAFALAAMMALGTMTGCSSGVTDFGASSGPKAESTGSGGQKIYYTSSTTAASNISPHGATSVHDSEITDLVTAYLYRYVAAEDRESAVIVPDLAADYPKQIDDYTWEITIDERACWADGVPITADTILQSWKYAIDPILVYEGGANVAQGTINIKNAYAYYTQGDSNTVAWEDVGLQKVDDLTFRIITEQKYSQQEVMRFTISQNACPVRVELYEELMNETGTATQYGSDAEKFISCGPFILTSWIKGSERVFVKNPRYLHADEIPLDGIHVKIVSDAGTQLQMFESGKLDFLSLSAEGYKKYEEDPRVTAYGTRSVRQIEINRTNTEKPILGSRKFRQALYYATDRKTLAELGGHNPAPYYITDFTTAYSDGTRFRDLPESQSYVPENHGYDPQKARQLFEEACAETGQTGKLVLTMNYYDSREDVKMMSEYLQRAWPEIFGADRLEIRLQALPSATLFDVMKASANGDPNSYELSWSAWSWSSSDFVPSRIFEPFQSDYSRRNANYGNAELDALYRESITEEGRMDENRIVQLAQEMERIYIEDVLAIPVFQVVEKAIFSDRLITPVNTYVSGLGWGTRYFDIMDET